MVDIFFSTIFLITITIFHFLPRLRYVTPNQVSCTYQKVIIKKEYYRLIGCHLVNTNLMYYTSLIAMSVMFYTEIQLTTYKFVAYLIYDMSILYAANFIVTHFVGSFLFNYNNDLIPINSSIPLLCMTSGILSSFYVKTFIKLLGMSIPPATIAFLVISLLTVIEPNQFSLGVNLFSFAFGFIPCPMIEAWLSPFWLIVLLIIISFVTIRSLMLTTDLSIPFVSCSESSRSNRRNSNTPPNNEEI